ncbi:MRC1-like domain-containing protein [Lipomyces japonicus]|uniref:MRC1-like domain-containing protein n=1 Tax=Lipomyces japonicus TaxID=56871 RepID=UPI0034CDFE25
MERETARLQRNRQLAYQPTTVKKYTTQSLFDKFNFNPANNEFTTGQPSSSSSIGPLDDDDEDEDATRQMMRELTPPSSLPDETMFDKSQYVNDTQFITAPFQIDSESELDSDHEFIDSTVSLIDTMNTIGQKNLTVKQRQGQRELEIKQQSEDAAAAAAAAKAKNFRKNSRPLAPINLDDSDSELEIETTPDMAKSQTKINKPTDKNIEEYYSYHRILERAGVRFQRKKIPKKGEFTFQMLQDKLAAKMREQAQKEIDDKKAEIEAKGGIILTSEQKLREDELIENLLEQERKNAEAVSRKERREKQRRNELNNGDEEENDDEDDAFLDDGDEDEHRDYDDDEGDLRNEDIRELLSDEAEDDSENEEEKDLEDDVDGDGDDDLDASDAENESDGVAETQFVNSENEVTSTTKLINQPSFIPSSIPDEQSSRNGLTQFFEQSSSPEQGQVENDAVMHASFLIEAKHDKSFPAMASSATPSHYGSEPTMTPYDFSKYEVKDDSKQGQQSQNTVPSDMPTLSLTPLRQGSLASSDLQIRQRELENTQADDNDDESLNIKQSYFSPDQTRQRNSKLDSKLEKASSYSLMLKSQRMKENLQKRRYKNSKELKEMFDEDAEESEDEWAGIGGESDSGDSELDEPDSELDEMVNDNFDGTTIVREDMAALHAAHELDQDSKLVADLVKGVHGGFRKRRDRGGFDLSDSDDEQIFAEQRRKRRDKKRKQELMKDKNLSDLADNPKARAFYETIEDDEVKVIDSQVIEIHDLATFING